MKLAKKVLAVVMALAMIGCFALTVLAAPAGAKYELKTTEVDEKGIITVTIIAKDCIGLKSSDITVGYDANALTFKSAKATADSDAATKSGNTFSGLAGKAEVADGKGTVKYAYNFLETLYTTEDFVAAAENNGETITIDANNFQVVTLRFEVVVGTVADTTVTVTGSAEFEDGALPIEVSTVVKTAVEAPTEAPTEAPAETTTATANPDTGDQPNTGDNMALAAAAGVLALAGAAFIITKKRK